jgi:hypothetical protein
MCSKSSKPNPTTMFFGQMFFFKFQKIPSNFSFIFERKIAQKHLVVFNIICV